MKKSFSMRCKSTVTLLATVATVTTIATVTTSNYALAATAQATATYNAANDSAAAEYKIARAKCDSLADNPKDVCIAEAKAARTLVEANAKAVYKNTVSAHTTATKDIADANYEVEKAKCGSQSGNAKDVCIKTAKSNQVTAVSNATAYKKVSEARTDAKDDKNTAEYKIALEKCDSSTGTAKDNCIAAAKKQFGK